MEISDITSLKGPVFTTIVSRNIVYFVSFSINKKVYKYDLESKTLTYFDCEDFERCININYNNSTNRVYVTVSKKGVYWFEPGKENQISRMECFPTDLSNKHKMGMVFNGAQGILKNNLEVYFCPNLMEDKISIKLDIESSGVTEVVFLDNYHVAALNNYRRKIVIVNVYENKMISEIEVQDDGCATSMSIDKDRTTLVVGVRDGTISSESSSWGYIHQFRVENKEGKAPTINKVGEPLSLGNSNTGIYDLKITRMPKFSNQLMILASIFNFFGGNK